ncbi:MAG TPA: hypothetical protein VE821_08710, partial [Pyrinomonadaceae bacterium]|nr:hypothetical protein [Pyrinomonadaceae bacterium]
LRRRRNLDEIKPALACHAHGVARVHDAELFAIVADDAHLWDADAIIDTRGRLPPIIWALSAPAKTW